MPRKDKKKSAATMAKDRERSRRRKASRRAYYSQIDREERERTWAAILAAYGPRCCCCGEGGVRFLTLDHVNGGGSRRAKTTAQRLLERRTLVRHLQTHGRDPRYQILCWNCNCARGHYGTCHDGSPLDPQPRPTRLSSRSNGVEHGVRGSAPGPSQLELPTHDP